MDLHPSKLNKTIMQLTLLNLTIIQIFFSFTPTSIKARKVTIISIKKATIKIVNTLNIINFINSTIDYRKKVRLTLMGSTLKI